MADRASAALLAGIAIAVVGLDQLSKRVVEARLGASGPGTGIALAGDWVRLEYVENRGAAFGIFSGFTPLLAAASVAIVLFLVIQFSRAANADLLRAATIGMIVGGAIGNLLDRVRLGYVVDFISVGSWPKFNIADSAITIGVATLVIDWVLTERQAANVERA